MDFTGVAGVALGALFPVLLFGVVGALADRGLNFDRQTLSKMNVYVLLPPLLFTSLMKVQVDGETILRVLGFTVLIYVGMALLGYGFAKWRRQDGATTSSIVLGTTLFNGFNLGFPMAAFAFGEKGLLLASVLIAANTLPHNALGIFIAARGALSTRETLQRMIRMPVLWVLFLAIAFRLTQFSLPPLVMDPLTSLGQAAIPFTLACVGMEIGRMSFGRIGPNLCGIVILRLLIAPFLAFASASLMGLSGMLRDVVILQASMPCAIAPIIYARLFGGNVDVLSRAVFYSTIGSLITIPLLLAYLQS